MGSVPRVGEGSTGVRVIQEGWRDCGIGGRFVGRNGADVGIGGTCVGLYGAGPGTGGAGEGDSFFGVRGANGLGGCGRGVRGDS